MLSSSKSSAFSSYDPYFDSRVVLLQGDGTTGGRNNNFVDVSGTSKVITQAACGMGSFSPYHTDGWGWAFSGSAWAEFQNAPQLIFGTNAFTIEGFVWLINGADTGGGGRTAACLIAKGNATAYWQINLISGGTFISPSLVWLSDLGSSTSTIIQDFPSETTPGSNRFVHFAVCRDSSGNLSFCLDGTVYNNSTDTRNFTETNLLTIGNNASHTLGLKGFISGLRIINGSALYSGASSSTYAVPSYPLSSTAGTTATGSKIKLNEIALLTAQSKYFEDLSIYNTPPTAAVTGSTEIRRIRPNNLVHKKYSINTLGTGIAFNGTTSALSATASADFQIASGTAFTVEAWIYSRNVAAAASYGIVGYNNLVVLAGAGGWVLSQGSNGGVTFNVYDANIALLSSVSSPTFVIKAYCWNHIALSYDGTTAVLYVNGKAVASGSLTNTTYTGAVLYVGRWNYSSPRFFDGYIADVHIAKGTAKYTRNFTPPTSPVTAIANSKLLINGLNAGILDGTSRNVVVPTGTPTISTNFKKNGTGSIAFNGTTDYLSLPTSITNALGRDDFTVEGWFYIKTHTTNSTLFEIGTLNNAGGLGVFWSPDSGTIVRLSGTSDFTTAVGDLPPLNQWVHIAVVRSTVAGVTSLKLYFNGIAKTFVTRSNPYQEITGTTVNIGWSVSTGVFINGFIDDFRISRRAEYTRNFTPPGRLYNY